MGHDIELDAPGLRVRITFQGLRCARPESRGREAARDPIDSIARCR